jgi:tetraacyldisaccharide 4'-kinase
LAYDRGWLPTIRASVPVVSVGNLTVGGTGKTPVVEMIARWFRDRDVRAAVLSRGYGAAAGPNDEAMVLRENLPDVPQLQGADRVKLAEIAATRCGCELLVLDDGMQHRRIHRDLEIVLVDALCPFGGGWTLPGGLLREAVSGIARADVVGVTRCDAVSRSELDGVVRRIRRSAGERPIVEIQLRPAELLAPARSLESFAGWWSSDPSCLSGRSILAFCGVGNPEAFRRSLEQLGVRVVDFLVYDDHRRYTAEDVRRLSTWAAAHNVDLVATTQKDWVKLRVGDLGGRPLAVLRVEAVALAGRRAFEEALEAVRPTRRRGAS